MLQQGTGRLQRREMGGNAKRARPPSDLDARARARHVQPRLLHDGGDADAPLGR